jgi:hypothetical protein
MNAFTRRRAILNGLSSLAGLALAPKAHAWLSPTELDMVKTHAKLVPLPGTKAALPPLLRSNSAGIQRPAASKGRNRINTVPHLPGRWLLRTLRTPW